jgi:hypothetical protein
MLDMIEVAKNTGASEYKLDNGTKVWAFTAQQLSVFAEQINLEARRIIIEMREQINQYKIDARRASASIRTNMSVVTDPRDL